jgi:hypothetical protein
MKLTNGMKVIAPSGCESYLTEGKEYEVFDGEIKIHPDAEIGEGSFIGAKTTIPYYFS